MSPNNEPYKSLVVTETHIKSTLYTELLGVVLNKA